MKSVADFQLILCGLQLALDCGLQLASTDITPLSPPIGACRFQRQLCKSIILLMKKALATNQLNKLMERKFDVIKEFQKIHYDEFCKYLTKVKNFDQMNQLKVKGISNSLNRVALFHPRPIDEIVYTYQRNYYRGFDEDILAMNIKTLGSIFRSFGKDAIFHSGDQRPKHLLFFEDRFQNMMNDARYAFQRNVYISNKNLSHILQGINEIGYLERQFVELMLEKLECKATDRQEVTIDPSKTYYQMNRLYYYAQGHPLDRAKLQRSSDFNKNLSHILNQDQNQGGDRPKLSTGKATDSGLLPPNPGDEAKVQQILSNIEEEIQKSTQNLQRFVEALISLRLKYLQMTRATNLKIVSSDPNLNTDLLDLEENLLHLKIIRIEEIKDISLLTDRQSFIQTTKSIALQLLKNPQQDVSKYIEMILEKHGNLVQSRLSVPSNIGEEVLYFGKMISLLAELTSSLNKEIRRDGLIQSRWKLDIMDENNPDEKDMNLNCDRAFKKVYHLAVENLNDKFQQHSSYVKRADSANAGAYLKGLIDMGLHEKAERLLNQLKVDIEGADWNKLQVISWVEVASTFSEHKGLEKLNRQLIRVISAWVQDGTLLRANFKNIDGSTSWGMYELCTIINWLLNTSNDTSPLYATLTNILRGESQLISSLHIHPYRGMIKDILSPGELVPHSNYDQNRLFNPIIKVVKKKILSLLGINQSQEGQSYVPFGFVDLDSGAQRALSFLPSHLTSYSGQHIDCNLKAHYKRMLQSNNVKVQAIPFMRLVTYCHQTEEFEMESKEELGKIIDSIKAKQFKELGDYLGGLAQRIADQYQVVQTPLWRDAKTLEKVSKTLRELKKHMAKEGLINNRSVAIINRHKIVHTFLRLHKELSYFSEQHRSQISQVVNTAQLQGFISKVFPKMPLTAPSSKLGFVGKRQTISTLDTPETTSQNAHSQILDPDFMDCSRYNQYEDWKADIQQSLGLYNCSEISINDCTDLTKALIHGTSTLSIPVLKPRNIVRPPYVYNWEHIYKQADQKQFQEAVQIQKAMGRRDWELSDDLRGKVGLQNLKYELKQGKRETVVDLLTELDFVEDLIDEHLTPRQNSFENLLTRDPRKYFQYLQQKPKDAMLESPYVNYILSKVGKRQQLKQLLEFEREKSVEYLTMARLNQITPLQYNNLREKLHKLVLTQIDKYRSEVMDQQFTLIKDTTNNVLKTTLDEEEFGRILSMTRMYSMDQDVDMILADGDFERALSLKRHKAQQKLIQLRIICKLNQGKLLTSKEKDYLSFWTKNTNQSILEQTAKDTFTSKRLGDLSEKDRHFLDSFQHSRLPTEAPNLRLTELVLQLGHLYDDTAINDFQNMMVSEAYSRRFNIPAEFFCLSRNKETAHLLRQLERSKFDEESKLTGTDISNILEITKYMKTEQPVGRQLYSRVYGQAQQELRDLNELPNRNSSIVEWYRRKEEEFDAGVTVQDLRETKKQEVQKVWKQISGKNIEQTTSRQLTDMVHSLCERLFVMRKSPPPFISNLVSQILSHPQLDKVDRNLLVGSLQLSKFPLTIDSTDMIRLSRQNVPRFPDAQTIKSRIQQSQGKVFNTEILQLLRV